ncbi:MFS general substrate transporter [Neoconidiobolus thromboides FSU 785]|nr:MFS general substrate transporter [Neoconidiobolus thromboides FSU 785]
MKMDYSPLFDSYKAKGIQRDKRPKPLDLNYNGYQPLFDIIKSSGIRMRSARLNINLKSSNKLIGINEVIKEKIHSSNIYNNGKNNTIPKSFIFLQTIELFINVGLRSILIFYLNSKVGTNPEQSKHITHLFGALIYLFPLIIGIISDMVLNEYYCSLICIVILNIGLLILFLTSFNPSLYFYYILLSLFLISIGLGGLKPNLNSLAILKMESNNIPEYNIKRYFNYNFIFNTLSITCASFIVPYLISFRCNKSNQCYPIPFSLLLLLSILMFAIFLFKNDESIKKIIPKEKNVYNNKYINNLINTFLLMSPLSFFWMLYDQGMTVWQYQYENMNKEWLIPTISIPTEIIGSITNFLLITILILIIFLIDPLLNSYKIQFNGMPRMIIAFLCLITAYIGSNILQYKIQQNQVDNLTNKVYLNNRIIKCDNCLPGSLQIFQLFFQALAEALLGTSTPQFAYSESHNNLRNITQGILFLTNSIGNFLVYFIDGFVLLNTSTTNSMWAYIGLSIIANIIFIFLYFYKKQ